MKKLRRAKTGKKLMGVCSGIATFFDMDPTIIRIVWVILCLFPPISTITAVILYIVLAFIIPEETDYIDV